MLYKSFLVLSATFFFFFSQVTLGEFAFTVQILASGTDCNTAVANGEAALNSGQQGYNPDQANAQEFSNMNQAAKYCGDNNVFAPPAPAEGPWVPVATYEPSSDGRCSRDSNGNYHTQQKFFSSCPLVANP